MEVKPIEFEDQATLAPALVVKIYPHAQYARGGSRLGTKP